MRSSFLLTLAGIAAWMIAVSHPIDATTQLARDGTAVIEGVVPLELCRAASEAVDRELRNPEREIGDIKCKIKRENVHMPLEDPVLKKVYDILYARSCDAWAAHLGCRNPRVVEWTCLLTVAGAKPQEWHRDVSYAPEEARMISVGVALQDIDADMGPLEVVLGTHRNDTEEPVGDVPAGKRMTCRAGDIVAWDASVVHRGGANTTRTRKIVLITVAGPGPLPEGSTYSIKEKYKKTTRSISSNKVVPLRTDGDL